MSPSRHPSSAPAATDERNTPSHAAMLRATGTVTSDDGTVVATVSRRAEHPADDNPGGSPEEPVAVVEVAGDIDAETAPLLRTVLTDAIRYNRRVCCDLNGVGFLGADAVNMIFAVLADADRTGCVVTVRGVHGIGARVFDVTGLSDFLASRA